MPPCQFKMSGWDPIKCTDFKQRWEKENNRTCSSKHHTHKQQIFHLHEWEPIKAWRKSNLVLIHQEKLGKLYCEDRIQNAGRKQTGSHLRIVSDFKCLVSYGSKEQFQGWSTEHITSSSFAFVRRYMELILDKPLQHDLLLTIRGHNNEDVIF